MRKSLATWISDADALRHLHKFQISDIPASLDYHRTRRGDYYSALVGELFDSMRTGQVESSAWATLGNAFAQFATIEREARIQPSEFSVEDATLFAATAFYIGGFPASAYLTMKTHSGQSVNTADQACFDLLARPRDITSVLVNDVVESLRRGDLEAIAAVERRIETFVTTALEIGPDRWIPTRLFQKLISQFQMTNLRAVLPEGASDFWTPLISSLINRHIWEFFPSQISALRNGLLTKQDTFSLQMPTGAGKTALCETLLYWHLRRTTNDAAVLLVPYRSLASELRGSLVKRLNSMGIIARCAYGGTVPSGEETHEMDATRALVATPETLSGILSTNPDFAKRISLVICDEGHLLDSGSRGVGLELLLSRMKIREEGSQRFVFVSAIVPNIEEINLWLGGNEESVVRSDYRPALAEFSVLRPSGVGAHDPVTLEMHPHEDAPIKFSVEGFLRRTDFRWVNSSTGRSNSYPYSAIKTRAIAAARKALPMGATVVFSANKRGDRGAIGLAEELLKQIECGIPLPAPIAFAKSENISAVAEYLEFEYGVEWIGTRSIRAGAVLHHGDIPQETREVVEQTLRDGDVIFGICTSTLSEGVNLPIRTLVLYSVQRQRRTGGPETMLTRDIKNLVGRAGRAGASTKGLVICVNEQQWPLVENVARQVASENVVGALFTLVERVKNALARNNLELTNEILESTPEIHCLVDGVDAILIDLAATEIGEDELTKMAIQIANETFASRQADDKSKELLQNVFKLRSTKIVALRSENRLEWVRDSGAWVRMLEIVEKTLLPLRQDWETITDLSNSGALTTLLTWAWDQPDLQRAVREGYRLDDDTEVGLRRDSFLTTVSLWLGGNGFIDLAQNAALSMDDMLGLHARAIAFNLQTLIEQGVALLGKLLLSEGRELASTITLLPEYLRFGVPTPPGRILATGGLRHRRAFVSLGNAVSQSGLASEDKASIFSAAREILTQNVAAWRAYLGDLVTDNTMSDLQFVAGPDI